MGLKNYLINRRKKKFKKKHKVGLCLSGGGARGFSYIGVFKALEELGIKFDAVAGTSAGSLFGAMFATGISADEMIEKTKNIKTKDFRSSKLGFLPSKMDRLHETLTKVFGKTKIEDLKIPYFAVAVDLKTGKEVHFVSGDLCTIITGSCAIPGVFIPVKYKNMTLIDGGVSNNIPADVLRDHGCDFVVTIDCNSTRGGGTTSSNLITQFVTSVGIMMANNSKKGLAESDLIISPDMKRFSSLNVNSVNEMIQEGYNAVMANKDALEALFRGEFNKN